MRHRAADCKRCLHFRQRLRGALSYLTPSPAIIIKRTRAHARVPYIAIIRITLDPLAISSTPQRLKTPCGQSCSTLLFNCITGPRNGKPYMLYGDIKSALLIDVNCHQSPFVLKSILARNPKSLTAHAGPFLSDTLACGHFRRRRTRARSIYSNSSNHS